MRCLMVLGRIVNMPEEPLQSTRARCHGEDRMGRKRSLCAGAAALLALVSSPASAQSMDQLLKGADRALTDLFRGKQPAPTAATPSQSVPPNRPAAREWADPDVPRSPPPSPPKAPRKPKPAASAQAASPPSTSKPQPPPTDPAQAAIKRNAEKGATGCTYRRTRPGGASHGGSTSACDY